MQKNRHTNNSLQYCDYNQQIIVYSNHHIHAGSHYNDIETCTISVSSVKPTLAVTSRPVMKNVSVSFKLSVLWTNCFFYRISWQLQTGL